MSQKHEEEATGLHFRKRTDGKAQKSNRRKSTDRNEAEPTETSITCHSLYVGYKEMQTLLESMVINMDVIQTVDTSFN